MIAIWPGSFLQLPMGEVCKINECSLSKPSATNSGAQLMIIIDYATLLATYGSVATPEILEAAVFVVRWRGWCGDYRQGRSQLLHYPRQEDAPGLQSLRTWRHLGGLKELGMLQHFFSSTSLVYPCVTWFHKPWRHGHWHDKSSKFKVQSLTWLAHARATVWCNTPPHVRRRSCIASCVGQEHS